jgi:hypothetical protein
MRVRIEQHLTGLIKLSLKKSLIPNAVFGLLWFGQLSMSLCEQKRRHMMHDA